MTVTAPLPTTGLPAAELPAAGLPAARLAARLAAARLPAIERLELPAAGLTRDVLLRACETLRRRVARWTTGQEGASVGFLELALDDLSGHTSGQVVVRATVVASTDRWQRVRYDVSLRPSPVIVIDGLALELPVGHAVGQTVTLAG